MKKKNPEVPPNTGGRVSRQTRGYGWWLTSENILRRHFEKYVHDIDLKLTEHVNNTISLLCKQKTGWNSDIWNCFSEKCNFGLYFAENRYFRDGHVLLHHCDVIRWPISMIWVLMEREDPTLYYDTKQLYFGRVNFKSTGGGNHPLRKTCYKKGSGRRGLREKYSLR